jgi:hypothetical protein
MIADLMNSFISDKCQKIKELQEEVAKIIAEKKLKEIDEQNVKEKSEVAQKQPLEQKVSSKRVQPLTRVRKNVEEIKQIQKNPEQQFIIDRISDIFK